MDERMQTLERLFAEGRQNEAEPYLIRELKKADEEKRYEDYAAIANQMVGLYQATGQYDKAAAASEDLLLLLEELQQDETEYFAMVLLNHANGYRDGGRAKEAGETYRRCEALLRQLGGSDLSFAALDSNLGLFYLGQQEYAAAEQAFRAANKRFAAAGAEDDPHFLTNLAGAGEALFRQGKGEAALEQYEKALALLREQGGADESYALLCQNCAAVAESLGDPLTAQQYRDCAEAASRR